MSERTPGGKIAATEGCERSRDGEIDNSCLRSGRSNKRESKQWRMGRKGLGGRTGMRCTQSLTVLVTSTRVTLTRHTHTSWYGTLTNSFPHSSPRYRQIPPDASLITSG